MLEKMIISPRVFPSHTLDDLVGYINEIKFVRYHSDR